MPGSADVVVLRLVLAAVLGGLIGYERESAHRPAGLRTHILVCVGSALVMLVSERMTGLATAGSVDPGRIAAQVVSGVGFLGAGTILREGMTIRGLTTAASLWVVAGIGLAVGAGLYLPAATTALIILLALIFLTKFERLYMTKAYYDQLLLRAHDQPGLLGRIGTVLGEHGISIRNVQLKHAEDQEDIVDIELTVLMPTHTDANRLSEQLLGVPGVVSLQRGE